MTPRFVDELDVAFGWVEAGPVQRTSHALAADAQVWLVDPVDGDDVERRLRRLGKPAGVLQLLDRHDRDGARWAERLGVPLHVVPDAVDGAPFAFLPLLRSRFWREAALWWPERRILVCADAVGTVPDYFRAGGEALGVHPLLRLTPPRRLRGLEPLHVLVGHGEGVHGSSAAPALEEALATSRRRIPRWLVGLPRLARRSR